MIAGDGIRVNWDQAAIQQILRGPGGEVAKVIEKFCIKVQAKASRLCPVDTGRLRSSISYDVGADAKGIVGYVGSNVEYAPYVEFKQPFLRPALFGAGSIVTGSDSEMVTYTRKDGTTRQATRAQARVWSGGTQG